jgi:type I restriction enzyme, S subunit
MRLDTSDLRYSGMSVEKLREQDALLHPGDLLFTRYSGSREFVGVSARVPEGTGNLTYPDKLIRVRVPGIDTRFLVAAVTSPHVRSSVERVLRTTAGQVGISGSALKNVRIPIAPLAEQRRIVAALEDHLSRLDAAARSLARTGRRLDSLNRAIRDSAVDESADAGYCKLAELVERVEAGRSFGGAARPAKDDEWGIIKVSAMTWGSSGPPRTSLSSKLTG